jgi:hypothetical protein
MEIWKSKRLDDPNLYCFYDDINRLCDGMFPGEPVLLEEQGFAKIVFPFGVGFNCDSTRFLCQADAILWAYDYHPSNSREVLTSLERVGISGIAELRAMVEDAKCKP